MYATKSEWTVDILWLLTLKEHVVALVVVVVVV
jgi:hypothetical protein